MGMNARQRNALQRGGNPFDRGMKKLRLLAEEIGGANDPGVQAGAKVLVKSIKKVLAKKAPGFQKTGKRGKGSHYGTYSHPGEAPHRQSGALYKSIGKQVVTGVLRVGSSDFTAPMLNDGAIVDEQTARAIGARKGKVTSRRARKGHRRYKIEPRPFMEPGLERARASGMTDAVVSALHRKGDKLLG